MSEVRTCSRPIQSCFQCRKRKIKCNRAYPCAPCLLRGEGDVCREVDRNLASSSKTTVETLDDVVNRVAVLEKTVSKLSKSIASGSGSGDNGCFGPPKSITMPPHQLTHEDFEKHHPAMRSPDEEAALMLEDIALGNRMNRRRAASLLEPNSTLGRAHSFSIETVLTPPILAEQGMYPFPKNPSPSSLQLPAFGLPSEHPLSLLVDPSTNVVHLIVSILPDELISRSLVDFYFDRIDWYTKIFHYPSFMSEIDNLLAQISLFSSHTASSSPTPPRISFPFLSIFFMVLCLTHQFIEPEVCGALNINYADATAQAKKFYNAAQVCLWIDNFLANHSLESVQSLILMGIYQQNLDDSDSHWALLGSAIKIAQNLGLARLGSESDNKTYSGPWKSVIRREVARRVWWNLIYGDWSHAAAHNGVYAVHPSQNGTGYPANINDVDLVDGQPLKEAQGTQYTEMTYSLTRFRFVEIYRQIVDNMENPTGYGFIVETDARLRDMLEVDLPAMFQVGEHDQHGSGSAVDMDTGCNTTSPSTPTSSTSSAPASASASASASSGVRTQTQTQTKQLEYTISLIMGETRRLRLHRPFLFRGYKDRKYGKSKEQCIASARAVLNILKADPEQAAGVLKWWLVMFYGFAAAVVLFIDYCHLRGDDPNALETRKKELHDALNLFKQAQHLSGVSQNAINLLEGMMTAAEQRVSSSSSSSSLSSSLSGSGGSRKRSAPDDSEQRWDRMAKKTIVSANRKVGLTRSPLVPSAVPSKYDTHTHTQSSPELSSVKLVESPMSVNRPFGSPQPGGGGGGYHLSPGSSGSGSGSGSSSSAHSPHPGAGGGVVWSHTTHTHSSRSHTQGSHGHGHGHGHGGGHHAGHHPSRLGGGEVFGTGVGTGAGMGMGMGMGGGTGEQGMFTSKDWNFLDSTAAMKAFDDVTISELGQLLWAGSGEDTYGAGGGGFDGGHGGGGMVVGHESHWGGILGSGM
ncbi:hypothetical protein E1B28_008152 [Marasmius oreades]|uniref:Zn(2)-C6 fungal-type domain-containing protein n=1 Tax=Marasmius oreades TaxID=181124 RepID=A0A9P7RXU6_9AGAR|nr:uncharacterized protein E1B28_008152 [Marasmius oreades]KAG7091751.1 hypothetical protein E1B28_008152 [Marasmius oreades]